MEECLREYCAPDGIHISKLTASTRDCDNPLETPPNWPTYDRIINLFEEVTAQAQRGDIVYIHYSGHGARVKSIFQDLKTDIFDEALVPPDIGNGGRYLRDVELACLIQRMTDKGLVVTVVFDCCHSGGLSRGRFDRNRIRGIGKVDHTILERDVSSFSEDELRPVARSPGFRGVTVQNNWLLGSRCHVFLAACQSQQVALEYDDVDASTGLLTHFLIQSIRKASRPLTYRQLYNVMTPQIAAYAQQVTLDGRQDVVLSGEANTLFCSTDRLEIPHACVVRELLNPTRVEIQSGTVHGVVRDMEFDVWPPACTEFVDATRVARLRVIRPHAYTSEASVTELFHPDQLAPGCLTVPVTLLSLQSKVRLVPPSPPSQDGSAETALEKIRHICESTPNKWISIVEPPEEAFFQVQVQHQTYHILKGNGDALDNAIPPSLSLSINNPNAAQNLFTILKHLAKYHTVLNLKSSRNNVTASWLSIALEDTPYTSPPPPRMADNLAFACQENTVQESDGSTCVMLRVKNESRLTLNIAVLDLDSAWAIEQIYPETNLVALSLEPGVTLELPLNVEGVGRDTLKVFATDEPTSLDWLRMSALGSNEEPSGRRGGNQQTHAGSVLGELQSAFVEDGPHSRKLRTIEHFRRGWVVKQCYLDVNDGEGDERDGSEWEMPPYYGSDAGGSYLSVSSRI
ncbi:hypothetical protein BO70DRAFT_357336 [Aspergillus heteromorphus CBS 117.55]|uniref:Peptidase C14 caspase domain-containing protein n=1 Tax=Aspergillus heteromorphus CBS 117.55 TaxID=1448321 RepID=A0A317X229_9EURO|nr:uncharacterized protein BO70DRAFT_357336 [Aspergillus heteromorphus CBS 117.55]PWY92191.1 hypothetical protein BO70DRAFT_357336 [Aspergillus heteromorphus CBS 117.55]